jgi:S-adenosylmethionine:tRNA ribosyltransferase-isomerase
MPELERLLAQYDYHLPPELIAQKPASPRDSARLLIYSRKDGKIKFDRFSNLGKYLPKKSVLVFNQTKVVPARLKVTKETGGKAEILYISDDGKLIKAIADRKLTPGTSVALMSGRTLVQQMKVVKKQGQFYFLQPNFAVAKIKSIMQKYGQTPLPPYIKNSPLTEKQKRKEYQSVFAKAGLSVAAPTASLHFTKKLISQLKKQGIEVKFVTLNVNLGTFAPLKNENLKSGKLHLESYEIDKTTATGLNRAKREGKTIVAVGTTVVRTLESAAKHRQLQKLLGSTDLFIYPPYKFSFVDSLITNFHVPKSSLLMLVSALTGRKKLLYIYEKAISKRFRFFSFGDGMLIL